MLEAEKRRRDGRDKIFPMHESVGALSESFVVVCGKIGAARTRHTESKNGPNTACSILLDLIGYQYGQCAAETMSSENDIIADRHGRAEERF